MPGLFQRFIHKPQQVWVRRALFQIHLWAGLIVGLYLIAIGLSGSILVFHDELDALARPASFPPPSTGSSVDAFRVAGRVRAAHPGAVLYTVLLPTGGEPVFQAWMQEAGRLKSVYADPLTGQLLPETRAQRCLGWIENLHIYLLAGETGLLANGIGAACLLLLSVTGIVIWWPGIQRWRRALSVDFRRNWKRINFDLHSVLGFWPLPLIAFWAVSGVYFAWPVQFVNAVKSVSALSSAEPPKYEIKPAASGARADWTVVLERAQALAPNAKLAGIGFSNGPTQPIVIDMSRNGDGDLLNTDYMYFHPATGEHLATWHYGANKTLGDWFIWLMHPLHFGTSWGLAIKLIWAALGMTLPLLTVTGALMYWNRYLGPKLKSRRRRFGAAATAVESSV